MCIPNSEKLLYTQANTVLSCRTISWPLALVIRLGWGKEKLRELHAKFDKNGDGKVSW